LLLVALSAADLVAALKATNSKTALGWKRAFGHAAAVIIVAHVLATALATVAVIWHGFHRDDGDHHEVWLAALLAVELACLGTGLVVHHLLHKSEPARVWAMSRLVAEVARSVQALRDRHFQLGYLFQLPLPERLRPVLRTLSALRLRSTRPADGGWDRVDTEKWKGDRNHYLADRVRHQIGFFTRKLEGSAEKREWGIRQRLRLARGFFRLWVLVAFGVTAAKLLAVAGIIPAFKEWAGPPALGVLGWLAIVLPTLAVATVSWATAMDYHALEHTYAQMIPFLKRQAALLAAARSAHEFEQLAFQTETQLLGEVLNWYYRRSFAEVS
jgi:hypothetical protein